MLVGHVAGGLTNTIISHFGKTSATNKTAQPQLYSSEEIIRLKNELDELLAYECPWCGERVLKTIDKPFIDPLTYEETYASWL
jgi:vacuolar protein sorting-associated protein 18